MHVGHEYVGTVEAFGSNVHDVKVGELVSGEGHIVCGTCRNCRAGRGQSCPNTKGVGVNRPGAFAEYLEISQFKIFGIAIEKSLLIYLLFLILSEMQYTQHLVLICLVKMF